MCSWSLSHGLITSVTANSVISINYTLSVLVKSCNQVKGIKWEKSPSIKCLWKQMCKWFCCWLSFDLVVVNLKLGSQDFSQLTKIGKHSTCGHDGSVSHLNKLRLVSSDNTVSLRKSWITSDNDKILTSNCNNCSSIIDVRVELISSVLNIWR